ncbi:MAG: NAD(P)H-dependent oxidoreductase subunit E [Myxococcota bacterium]
MVIDEALRARIDAETARFPEQRGGLLRQLEAHLGVRVGETTADGRIQLGREECLGACANAPMIRIGGSQHDDLGFEGARDILDALE